MTELPPVRIVRGEPDEVELAALVAGLAAARADDDAAPARPGRSAWERGALRGPGFGRPADGWRWSLRG